MLQISYQDYKELNNAQTQHLFIYFHLSFVFNLIFCYYIFPWQGNSNFRIFYRCILTGRAMKLILYEFSSNFLPEMWVENFFLSGEKFGHTGLFVGGHQQNPLIKEIRKVEKLGNSEN